MTETLCILAAEWGQDGAFPSLKTMNLSLNPISGSIPNWGISGSMQQLSTLKLDQLRLNGMTPTTLFLPASSMDVEYSFILQGPSPSWDIAPWKRMLCCTAAANGFRSASGHPPSL